MINELKKAIDEANKIVFFTGAGISTDSGIPDFRSATGLYKNVYRAEEMLSHTFFVKYPEDFYEFYKDKMIYQDAQPNYGHIFMAKLQNSKDVTVVTQNIDGLHQLAGSKNVLELHGSVLRNYCTNCDTFYSLADVMRKNGVPYCDKCGHIIKPDVVLYEEGLDETTIIKTIKAIETCDLLVICGTSLNVYPAASFINYFKGKNLAIINKDSTSKDDMCNIVIHDSISNVFKQINLD